MMKAAACVLACGLALVGCERKDSSSGGMGRPAISADETALLEDLPSGNQLVFGGNFLRLQKFMHDSPLSKLSDALNSKTPGATEWQACFTDGPGISMVGTAAYTGNAIIVR